MTTRFLHTTLILVFWTTCGLAQDSSWIGADEDDSSLNHETANRIELILKERTSCDFSNNPLEEVISYLEAVHKIPIWIDRQALQDEGVAPDQQVTLQKSNITLQTAFVLILEPIGLTTVTEHGLLVVTTQAKADEKLVTRIYPVADLINTRYEGAGYDTLISVIMNQTSGKWIDIDSEGGGINSFPNAHSLVIRQTQKAHRQIEGILAALRKAKRLQKLPSIPVETGDLEDLNPIEPIKTTSSRPTLRKPRFTPAWQRPRIHANH